MVLITILTRKPMAQGGGGGAALPFMNRCVLILGIEPNTSEPYLALTPATACVGRCHKNFWQVSAGVRQFGRGTWKLKHTHTQVWEGSAGH